MTTDIEKDIVRLGRAYQNTIDAAEDVIVEAMCLTYKRVTGKPATDKLRDALRETVRWHG